MQQGCCGSCYAVVLAQVLQDRYNSDHGTNITLNVGDILSFRKFALLWSGCEGGYIGGDRLESFMHTHGVSVAVDGIAYPPCALQCNNHQVCLASARQAKRALVDTPDYSNSSHRVRATQWVEVTHASAIQQLIQGTMGGYGAGPVAAGFGCLPSFDLSIASLTQSWPALSSNVSLGGLTFTKAFVPLRSECESFNANPNSFHAVSIVGWTTLAHNAFEKTGLGGMYWIVRNSWGTGWGDNGYALMASSQLTNLPAPFGVNRYAFDNANTKSSYKLPVVSAPSYTHAVSGQEADHDSTVLHNALEEFFVERTESAIALEEEEDMQRITNVVIMVVLVVVALLVAFLIARRVRARWNAPYKPAYSPPASLQIYPALSQTASGPNRPSHFIPM